MRTNEQIQQDVIHEIYWAPITSGSQIGVAVQDGIVTLTGVVTSYAQKVFVEEAAMRVKGVRAIIEKIEVKISVTDKKSDDALIRSILSALEWHPYVGNGGVRLKVEDGWVTLTGEVEWQHQRHSIINTINGMVGVRGITNLIQIAPKQKVNHPEMKLAEALQRNGHSAESAVQTWPANDTLMLTGTVRSLVQKQDIETIAWQTPGIREVHNQLNVDFTD